MSLYYQDDLVTLYHGDCLTDHREWLDADVLVTDPPYGVTYTSRGTYNPHTGKTVSKEKLVSGDSSTEGRDRVLRAWVSKPAVVFGSWRTERPANVEHRLIWWKRGQAPGPLNAAFLSQDEEIYIIGKGFRSSSPPQRSVIPTDEIRQGAQGASAIVGHPTTKPIYLMETLLDRCPPGVIADPFAGSGSTLVAAVNQGRRAIGVELEEKYCEVAAKRLQNHTRSLFTEVQ